MYRKKPGDELAVVILRDHHPLSFKITLKAQASDKDPTTPFRAAVSEIPRLGVVRSAVEPTLQAGYSTLRSRKGLRVEGRMAGGDLKADLFRGDVIRSVNRTDVSTVDEVRTIVEKLKPGIPVVLQVERKGEFIYVVAGGDPDILIE